jgi:hypothetical protein
MIAATRGADARYLRAAANRAAMAGQTPAAGDPCTQQTIRCATARNYGHALPACCRSHLRDMMTAIQEVFDQLGVQWWADYGTILGAVRNPMTTKADYPWLAPGTLPDGPLAPGIIPHDKDADLGALKADWQLLMRARAVLERRGFPVMVRIHSLSLKILCSMSNHTNVDVFTWCNMGADRLRRISYINVDHYKGRDFPAAWVAKDAMTTVPWEGLTLPAPANPEAFCAFRYGEAWKTPVCANHDGMRR